VGSIAVSDIDSRIDRVVAVSDDAVNLLSDTQTRPTAGMREAIAAAEVGDEQRGEDPTVNALQDRVAELLGHEAALFLPSGTMCNEIAFQLHLRPGEELLLHSSAHPIGFEVGGPAALAGAMVRPLDGAGGMFKGDDVRAAVRPLGMRHAPRTRCVSVEQTTNMGGGRVWPLEQSIGVLAAAAEHGLHTHLDGARLMNAVVASGVPAADWARGYDTAWIDFTKGLGAPVGAALAGSVALIEEAFRLKHRMGGAMRQAGVIAAGGLYALDHHVERLVDDHARARRLAEGLAALPGIELDATTVETNIVIFGVADAPAFSAGLAERGVRIAAVGPRHLRAVTHLDVDDDGIERALAAAGELTAG
jgi:threonine aldolase